MPVIAATLAKPYPQLTRRVKNIAQVLQEDEKKFAAILDRGWGEVEDAVQRIKAEGSDSFPRWYRLPDCTTRTVSRSK